MKVTFYSCFEYERPLLKKWNLDDHELCFRVEQLDINSVKLAKGSDAIAIFSRDKADRQILEKAADMGVKLICLRSTGYNNIDLTAASELGLKVARVSAYSPEAIAEHAMALILALSRNLIEAHQRVQDHNFSLVGLCGFNLGEKTVGVIGTGKIGSAFIKMLHGFGSQIIAYDITPDEELTKKYNVRYMSLVQLYENADIISLHIPLNKETMMILNESSFEKMKEGVIIINTSRGDHIETKSLLNQLRNGKVSAAGLDVYSNEKKYFFKDRSDETIEDKDLLELIEMKNVILTGHQAFLTDTALSNIAETTHDNFKCFQNKTSSINFLC